MRKLVAIAAAVALLTLAQGCADGDDPSGPATTDCTPAVHTKPDAAAAQQFCIDYATAMCGRAYDDCVALDAPYPTLEECVSQESAICGSLNFSHAWYDACSGSICMGSVQEASCEALATDGVPACDVAYGFFEFPPEAVATITPGTFTDTIGWDAPLYEGGPARAYAILLTAGQRVMIETAPPSGDTPIHDTVIHLFAPDTVVPMAENDDIDILSDNQYSRIVVTVPETGYYRIVVRGAWSTSFGDYQLTVTIL